MNIRFLETAICLADLRNFRATADTLNITPAAISSRVSAMEQEVGFKLFERDSRQVTITSKGQAFVDGARDIVSQYHQLVQDVDPSRRLKGTIRIGLVASMALALLPEIVTTLRQRLPDVQLSITTESSLQIQQKLDDEEIDIALNVTATADPAYISVDLCTLGMFWVAAPAVLANPEDGEFHLEDICAQPIIAYERRTYNHGCLMRYLDERGVASPVTHHSNALSTTIRMVVAGLGVAVVPPAVIQNELRDGSLNVLNVNPRFPSTSYAAIYTGRRDAQLCAMIASIAAAAARNYCALFDDFLASCPNPPVRTVCRNTPLDYISMP